MEKTRQYPAVRCGAGLLAALLLAGPAAAQEVMRLGSGLEITFHELIWDEELATGRFRFLAPDLAGAGIAPETLTEDLRALCRGIAVPRQNIERPGWVDVVISLSSEPLPFGTSDPEVAQIFEGFEIRGEDCIWTAF